MYVKSVANDFIKRTRTVNLEHTFALLKDIVSFGETKYENNNSPKSVITSELAKQSNAYWAVGSVDFKTGQPWEFNNSTIGDNLEDIAECCQDSVWTFDQSTLPWTVNLKQFSTDNVACEMRLSRNITGVNVNIDRGSMYTRVYPVGNKNLDIKSVNNGKPYIDMNTKQYGVIGRVLTEQSYTDAQSLYNYAYAELKRNSVPKVSVTINGLLMSQLTGESIDRLTTNTACRVALPDYGETYIERIV